MQGRCGLLIDFALGFCRMSATVHLGFAKVILVDDSKLGIFPF